MIRRRTVLAGLGVLATLAVLGTAGSPASGWQPQDAVLRSAAETADAFPSSAPTSTGRDGAPTGDTAAFGPVVSPTGGNGADGRTGENSTDDRATDEAGATAEPSGEATDGASDEPTGGTAEEPTATATADPGPTVDRTPDDTGRTGPLRILLSGDSITEGRPGDVTWRYRAWKAIEAAGVEATFVGTKTTLRGGTTLYADPDFDTRHAATSGVQLTTVVGQIAEEVRSTRSDVVAVLLGTNDLRHGRTPAQIADDMRSYIEQVRSVNPDAAIVVGLVPGYCRSSTEFAPDPLAQERTDRAYRQVAAELAMDRSPVVIADTQWDPEADTFDCVHPNAAGEVFLAQRMLQGISALGILPATTWHVPDMPWTGRLALEARMTTGGRVVLSWDPASVSATAVRIETVDLTDGTRVTHTYAGSTARTARLEPGTYEFRAVALRGTMTGTAGPPVRVTIPRDPADVCLSSETDVSSSLCEPPARFARAG